ncbi:wsc domain-containing protein [Stemphylium lycopersici]|uniref:WSC-domain-containing protein n=1 Tax=Stemphylium lycopersici TaxID=183478 RepID=A0A364MUN5_STELY|nr:wsc domain-containing protein [Stemphylium lycopersici]RAR04166.1 WSC-domain-containing protein [Stemphylium lycopersici]
MRPSGILVLAFAANAFALGTQQVLSSLNLPTSSYECKNGVKPSIVCDDASAEKPNCSCTCTNGVTFNQPLDPFRSPGSTGGAIDDTVCQAEKTECLAREQTSQAELTALKDQLAGYQNAPAYTYVGCFTDSAKRVIGPNLVTGADITVKKCETLCKGSKYYALQNGSECFCGKTFLQPTQDTPDTECKTPCKGDKNVTCGGKWRNAVYVKK